MKSERKEIVKGGEVRDGGYGSTITNVKRRSEHREWTVTSYLGGLRVDPNEVGERIFEEIRLVTDVLGQE